MYAIQTNSIDRIYRYIEKKYIYLHRVTSESAASFCHSGGRKRDEYIVAKTGKQTNKQTNQQKPCRAVLKFLTQNIGL